MRSLSRRACGLGGLRVERLGKKNHESKVTMGISYWIGKEMLRSSIGTPKENVADLVMYDVLSGY